MANNFANSSRETSFGSQALFLASRQSTLKQGKLIALDVVFALPSRQQRCIIRDKVPHTFGRRLAQPEIPQRLLR
jgi:hypothetical protein